MGDVQREKWISTDDRGVTRTMHITYDDRGRTIVSRELLHDLMTRAGLRLDMSVEEPES